MTVVHIEVADWVDIGILATQVLTVLAAGLAYLAIRKQIGDSERHHREQLHGSLRPLITVETARLVRTGQGAYIEVSVRNVGPGPALGVEITGWVHTFPQQQMPGWEARPHMDDACQTTDLDAPDFRLRLGAVAATVPVTERMAPEPGFEVRPVAADFLVYFATYADVFGNKFPAKPRSEWLPGHVTFSNPYVVPPRGTARV